MSKHSMRSGQFGQAERFLQRFLDGARVGLHHAEALIVGLLGVVAGEIDERALLAARRNFDVHAGGAGAGVGELFGEQVLPASSRSSKSVGT